MQLEFKSKTRFWINWYFLFIIYLILFLILQLQLDKVYSSVVEHDFYMLLIALVLIYYKTQLVPYMSLLSFFDFKP